MKVTAILMAIFFMFAITPITNAKTKDALADLPFSAVRLAGNMVYLSGQDGLKPGTSEMPQGITAQTQQTLENIKATLKQYQLTMNNIVSCTVYLSDLKNDFQDFNKVYATYFPQQKPTRTTIGVNQLAFNAKVEISCIAINQL